MIPYGRRYVSYRSPRLVPRRFYVVQRAIWRLVMAGDGGNGVALAQ